MKVSAGEHIAFANVLLSRSGEDQWIVDRSIHLDFKSSAAETERVANCSMHLGNAAQ